jgi:peroxiredoxin
MMGFMTTPTKSLASATLDLQKQLRAMVPAELLQTFVRESDRLGAVAFAARQAGEPAPSFALKGPRGNTVALADLLRAGPVVLTFYRGAWCPYCNLQLREYQAMLPELKKLGATLVAVSPQTPDHSLSVTEKNDLAFPVLSDPHNEVARSYGLVFKVAGDLVDTYKNVGSDLVKYNGDDSWELPAPGTFVIGRDGKIRLAFVDGDYTRRLEPAAILEALGRLDPGERRPDA